MIMKYQSHQSFILKNTIYIKDYLKLNEEDFKILCSHKYEIKTKNHDLDGYLSEYNEVETTLVCKHCGFFLKIIGRKYKETSFSNEKFNIIALNINHKIYTDLINFNNFERKEIVDCNDFKMKSILE